MLGVLGTSSPRKQRVFFSQKVALLCTKTWDDWAKCTKICFALHSIESCQLKKIALLVSHQTYFFLFPLLVHIRMKLKIGTIFLSSQMIT